MYNKPNKIPIIIDNMIKLFGSILYLFNSIFALSKSKYPALKTLSSDSGDFLNTVFKRDVIFLSLNSLFFVYN